MEIAKIKRANKVFPVFQSSPLGLSNVPGFPCHNALTGFSVHS